MTIATNNITDAAGTGAPNFPNGARTIRLGTAVASTSGTAIDFTGIPVGVRRVTVMFNGVSTSGTSRVQVQIGSGSFVTSGYASVGVGTVSTLVSTATLASGFATANATAAADVATGAGVLTRLSDNTWIWTCTIQRGVADGGFGSGSLALSGALDRIRITTVGGTDTFDAGSINIAWEF